MYHALSPEHLSHDNYTFVPLCTNQFCNFDLVNNLRASPAHRNKTPLSIPTASTGTKRRSPHNGQRRSAGTDRSSVHQHATRYKPHPGDKRTPASVSNHMHINLRLHYVYKMSLAMRQNYTNTFNFKKLHYFCNVQYNCFAC